MIPLPRERSMIDSVVPSAFRAPSASLRARSSRSLFIWLRRRLLRERLTAFRLRLLRRFLMADLIRATSVLSLRPLPVLEAQIAQAFARDAGLLGPGVGGDHVLQLDDRFRGPAGLEKRESFLEIGPGRLVAARVRLKKLIVRGDRLRVALLCLVYLADEVL